MPLPPHCTRVVVAYVLEVMDLIPLGRQRDFVWYQIVTASRPLMTNPNDRPTIVVVATKITVFETP